MDDISALRAQLREHGVSGRRIDTLVDKYSTEQLRAIVLMLDKNYVLGEANRPSADDSARDLSMLLDEWDETRAWIGTLSVEQTGVMMHVVAQQCKGINVSPNSPGGYILMGLLRWIVTKPEEANVDAETMNFARAFNALKGPGG